MSYWLITENGKIISKTSVEHVTQDDYLQVEIQAEINQFNRWIEESLDDANFVVDGEGEFDSMYLKDIEDMDHLGICHANDLNTPTATEYDDMHTDDRLDDDDEDAIDKYLNVELIMDVRSNDEQCGHVVKCSQGLDGEPIGRLHNNPLFDTWEYEVEFTDGCQEKYQVNIITENMFAQVDSEGNQYLLLKEITDHKHDNSAIPISEGMVRSSNGTMKPKVTTRGWFLLVQW